MFSPLYRRAVERGDERSKVGVSQLCAMHWRKCPPELTHPNIASLVLPSLLQAKKEGKNSFRGF